MLGAFRLSGRGGPETRSSPARCTWGRGGAGEEVCKEVACGEREGGSLACSPAWRAPRGGDWGGKGPQHPDTPRESQLFSTQITLSRPLLLGL